MDRITGVQSCRYLSSSPRRAARGCPSSRFKEGHPWSQLGFGCPPERRCQSMFVWKWHRRKGIAGMAVQVDELVICKGGLKRFRGTNTPLAPAQRKQGARDALKKSRRCCYAESGSAEGLFVSLFLASRADRSCIKIKWLLTQSAMPNDRLSADRLCNQAIRQFGCPHSSQIRRTLRHRGGRPPYRIDCSQGRLADSSFKGKSEGERRGPDLAEPLPPGFGENSFLLPSLLEGAKKHTNIPSPIPTRRRVIPFRSNGPVSQLPSSVFQCDRV